MLLDELLGDESEALGDAAKKEHGRLYANMASRLRPIGGGRELITELDKRGVRVVLATSAPDSELQTLLTVLRTDVSVYAVTSSEDVDTAKPDPGIIQVALDKAGVRPEDAVMVGDSVWDMKAAKRAGVRAIGVLSGGFGREELLSAGATEVFDDVSELLATLDAGSLTGTRA